MASLRNIGNTCFINTILQCLMNIDAFDKIFIDMEKKDIPEYELTKEYIDLRDLMKKECIISPNRFIYMIYKHTELKNLDIKPYQQNDVTEFLNMLIDCFHIALEKEVTMNINGDPKTEEDKILIMCLEFYKTYSKKFSYILELFYGIHVSSIVTLNNKTLRQIPEMHFIIDLPIPNIQNPCIYDCFDEYIKEEILEGENGWYNEETHGKENVKKNIKFCKLPEVLILSFNRLNNHQIKKNIMIDVPFEINLEKYCILSTRCKYVLKSVCNHHGNAYGGHYTASIHKDNKWIEYDDDVITNVEQVINPNIYCLFFHRI